MKSINLRVYYLDQYSEDVYAEVVVFVHCNQLLIDESLDCLFQRTFLNAGFTDDGFVCSPVVSLAAGATNEIGIQFEHRGVQRYMENLVGQTEEFLCGAVKVRDRS